MVAAGLGLGLVADAAFLADGLALDFAFKAAALAEPGFAVGAEAGFFSALFAAGLAAGADAGLAAAGLAAEAALGAAAALGAGAGVLADAGFGAALLAECIPMFPCLDKCLLIGIFRQLPVAQIEQTQPQDFVAILADHFLDRQTLIPAFRVVTWLLFLCAHSLVFTCIDVRVSCFCSCREKNFCKSGQAKEKKHGRAARLV